MADRSELIVGGYYFGSFEDAKSAEKEIKNAGYLDERLNSMKPSQMKAVYDKLIDEKVFMTPVGWEYLKYLKKRLVDAGIEEESIRPVPLYCNFNTQSKELKEKKEHVARQRIRPSNRDKNRVKDTLRISIIVNIFLALLVAAMFYITVHSDNPNIINYKQAITNQYSEWEQDLTERENALREKESQIENSGR